MLPSTCWVLASIPGSEVYAYLRHKSTARKTSTQANSPRIAGLEHVTNHPSPCLPAQPHPGDREEPRATFLCNLRHGEAVQMPATHVTDMFLQQPATVVLATIHTSVMFRGVTWLLAMCVGRREFIQSELFRGGWSVELPCDYKYSRFRAEN